ncbi:MAG: hypothetical protein HQK98_10340 [Nitrospirae bacterium]|nr:hypothetical protein [Nitrospirota bacterium]
MTRQEEMATLKYFTLTEAVYNFQVGDAVMIDTNAPVKTGDFILDMNTVIRKFDEAENIDYLGRVMWHYIPEQNLYPRCECCKQRMTA